jgi:CO/xanthine dehydrogenase Mo-binding subunit
VSDFKLIGQNYAAPDLVAKVTGAAKYAEDYRADGMLYCRLLRSPMPHARVRRLDTSEAMNVPGVRAILTADDLPPPAAPPAGAPPPSASSMRPEPALTMEPLYEGEPILAVAATDERAAVAAIERIHLELDPLPFVIDPLDSLRPGGPNARVEGNVLAGGSISEVKWTAAEAAELEQGRLAQGSVPDSEQWSYGDLEAGFQHAAVTIDETFVIPSTSHMPLEMRSALAYWQNGKLHMHCSAQGTANVVPAVARHVGIDPAQVVLISPYTGGGFGSKLGAYIQVVIPALLAKKTGQPVMMRITRDDEQSIGRTRPGMIGRARAGFARDGRMTALDLSLVSSAGPYGRGDHGSAARLVTAVYQPAAMRFRGLGVLTNVAPTGAQRGPGMQMAPLLELVMTKAARQLGLDHVAIHRVNAPAGKAPVGPPQRDGARRYMTSAFVKEALDRGADLFGWEGRKRRSGQRQGTKVRGIGVAVGTYGAGSIGFDGLLTIQPDGKVYVQSGVGHHGSYSVFDTVRAAAEVLSMAWDKVVITHGESTKHLPWSCSQGGSQTAHAHTRANWAAGLDAKRKLQEIAANDLGGRPEEYEVANERVFRKDSPSAGLTFAQAATRAIALGGRYDGHELPSDIHQMTRASASALAGRGLMGVAKDTFPRDGDTTSFLAGFAEVEVDVETGQYSVIDYTAVADCGTVLHPRSLRGQVFGGTLLGIAHATGHRWVYDKRYGVSVGRRFYNHRPPTILDAPRFQFAALDIPDPQTPVGVRGIGEPPVGAAYGAVVNALIDALGEEAFRTTPVTADAVLTALESGGQRARGPLTFTT